MANTKLKKKVKKLKKKLKWYRPKEGRDEN